MALRTGSVGLECEAGFGTAAGWARPLLSSVRILSGARRGGAAEFGPPVQPSRGPPQLGGGFGRSRRLAFNSQLRTGTDQGNPTV